MGAAESTRNRGELFGSRQIIHTVLEAALSHKQLDRRSERTRQLISEAFVALMREKLYSQITVQDIIERANIGRSTFYAHYQDKADLLGSAFEQVLNQLQQTISHGDEGKARVLPTTGLFAHMQQVQFIMGAFALDERTDLLFRHVHASLTAMFETYLAAVHQGQPPPSIPTPITANYLAGAYLSLARWWLDNNLPYTPERMDEIFQDLARPVIQFTQSQR